MGAALIPVLTYVGGAAIGAITWSAAALGLGASYYISRQNKKAQQSLQDQGGISISGLTQLRKDPSAFRRVIYGLDVKVAGDIVFAEVQSTNLLYLVNVLATHELEWNSNNPPVFLDNKELGTWTYSSDWWHPSEAPWSSQFIARWKSVGDSTADAQLIAELTSHNWTLAHKLQGMSYVVIKVTYHDAVWGKTGIPNIAWVVNGKPLYDSRTGNTSISANSALALRDYLTDTVYGKGVPSANINATSFEAAANVCDQVVDGEYRYTIHGSLSCQDSHDKNIQAILDTMYGELVCIGGVWHLYAGAYQTPVITLTDDDFIGPFNVRTRQSKRDVFNAVTGLYCSAETSQPDTYPEVASAVYEASDGEKISKEFNFPMINSAKQCQRIANIMIEDIHQEIEIDGEANLKALNLIPCKTVKITREKYGWSEKVFRITNWNMTAENGIPKIKLQAKETAAAVYDDYTATAADPAPDTNLPAPYDIDPPSNLAVTEKLVAYGDVVSNLVTITWDAPETPFTQLYNVQYKLSTDSVWIDAGNIRGTKMEIIINTTGNHDFKVAASNLLGAYSDFEDTTVELLGKTASPSDVTDLAAEVEGEKLKLSWSEITDLDRFMYEIKSGGSDWDSASFVGRIKGTEFLIKALAAGAYKYWIKAIDTTGHYSENADSVDITILAPETPSPTVTYSDNQIIVEWDSITVSGARFPIEFYEITFNGSFYARIKGTQSKITAKATGSYALLVKAIDIYGNAGSNGSTTVTVDAPGTPTVTSTVTDNQIVLDWEPVSSTFQIREYIIRLGAAVMAYTKSTDFRISAKAAGSYTYTVQPVDIYGNLGSAGSVTVTIQAPATPIDAGCYAEHNRVKFQYQTSATTFTIDDYLIKKGNTLASAAIIGPNKATAWTYIEYDTGEVSYWIIARDIYGNESAALQVTLTISEAPDYKFIGTVYADLDDTMEAVKSNCIVETFVNGDRCITGIINTTKTWADYIAEFGDVQTDKQLDEIYPEWYASYTSDMLDFGQLLPSGVVRFELDRTDVISAMEVYPTIIVYDESLNATSYGNTWAANVTYPFQYVQLTLEMLSGSEGSEIRAVSNFRNIRASVSLPRKEEMGTVSVGAGGSETITFTESFIDLDSLQLTVIGSSDKRAVADGWTGSSPTGFTVYLFDSSGNPTSGSVSWWAKGV